MALTPTPGYKTSEFWSLLLTSIVNLSAMLGVFTPDEADGLVKIVPIVSGGLGQAIIIVGYAMSRAKTKSN